MVGSGDVGGNMMLMEWPVERSLSVTGAPDALSFLEDEDFWIEAASAEAGNSAGAMQAKVNKPTPMVNRTGFATADVISKFPLFLQTCPSKAHRSG
jgi:hypothetical protein